MKTLYRNTPRIAAAILAALIVTTGSAIALTHDAQPLDPAAETIGRFVVTPDQARFEAPAPTVGRFVVTPNHARYEGVAHTA